MARAESIRAAESSVNGVKETLTPTLSRKREREWNLTPAFSREWEREWNLAPTLSDASEREKYQGIAFRFLVTLTG